MPNKIDLTGQRFGRWTVLYEGEPRYDKHGCKHIRWHCRCDCGAERDVDGGNLRAGISKSCGCGNVEDYIGKTFGRLTVLGNGVPYVCSNGNKQKTWRCKCSCGNIIDVIPSRVKSGGTTSCGCYQRECASKKMRAKNHNTYDIESYEYGVGCTNKGEQFKFDKKDLELLKDYCWFVNNSGYLCAKIRGSEKHIMMHNLVMNGKYIDHINNDKLDNRKCNLRFGGSEYSFDSYNQMNKSVQSNNKSGYPGISWHKRDKVWEVHISLANKQYYLGRYDNLEDAIAVRKRAEDKYFGEYAYRNSQALSTKEAV